MKKNLYLSLLSVWSVSAIAQNVGVDVPVPAEKLHIDGRLRLNVNSVVGAPTPATGGVIRWNGSDFEGWNGSAWVSLTALQGIVSLNGLTGTTQTFSFGSVGTSPAFSSAGTVHTLNIPMASTAGVTGGLLSNNDYTTLFSGLVVGPGTVNWTVRHNGTNWVPSSALVNDGSNIGIGAATPVTRLDVAGSGYATVGTGNRNVARFAQSTGSSGGGIEVVGRRSTGVTSSFIDFKNIDGAEYLMGRVAGMKGGSGEQGNLTFWTNNSTTLGTPDLQERMRIANDGTVRLTAYTTNGILRTTGGTGTLSSAGGGISLTSEVTGVLPIVSGGTNSSTALVNNRVMVSSGGAIVENDALTANLPVFTTASGLLTTTAPTTGTQGYWTRTGTNLYNTNLGDRVGIGVATPLGALHVSNTNIPTAVLQSSSNIGTWLSIGNSDPGGRWFQFISTATDNGEGPGKLIYTRGVSPGVVSGVIMTMDHASMNVGLGTTSPDARLHVMGEGRMETANGLIRATPTGWRTSNRAQLLIHAKTDQPAEIDLSHSEGGSDYGWHFSARGSAQGRNLQIFGRQDLTFTHFLTVKHADGNVGIGPSTADPTARLHVNGSVRFQSLTNGFLQADANGNLSIATASGLFSAGNGLSWTGTTLNSVWTSNGVHIHSNNTGNVGIGVAAPIQKLDILTGSSAQGMVIRSATTATNVAGHLWPGTGGFVIDARLGDLTGAANLHFRTNGTDRIYVRGTDGNVGIGNSNPTYKLQVTGAIRTNAINETSDSRLKKNVTELQDPLAKVLAMRGVNYEWRTDEFPEMEFDNKLQFGLIAQELEKVVPELVHTDREGWKSIEYSHIVPLLIEAIKELNGLVGSQQKTIEEMRVQNALLRQRVDAIDNGGVRAEAEVIPLKK